MTPPQQTRSGGPPQAEQGTEVFLPFWDGRCGIISAASCPARATRRAAPASPPGSITQIHLIRIFTSAIWRARADVLDAMLWTAIELKGFEEMHQTET
jgi:hypothetical protein